MDKKKKLSQEAALRSLKGEPVSMFDAELANLEPIDAPDEMVTKKQVILPKVVSPTSEFVEEVQGPGYPQGAVYPPDAEVRPVDLVHDEPYTEGALAAAKLLMKEEGFLPKAKHDVTRARVGYSSEEYENGQPVRMGDTVDKDKAYDMLMARILRDQKRLDPSKFVEILNDPSVEAVMLSRMYHQGPGNVVMTDKKFPSIYEALLTNDRKKFAQAIIKAHPNKAFKGRLNREAKLVLDSEKDKKK